MIDQLVQRIASLEGCKVHPPRGEPQTNHALPDDVRRFYALCGGAALFEGSKFPLIISSPEELVSSNEVIVGKKINDDPSDNWFLIAKSGEEQLVSIDLNPDKLGRCYDSFWDRHALVGSCSVIALSFTELLRRSVDTHGSSLYWLSEQFESLGDAYD